MEEDAELRALKEKNTSWRNIAQEMKRSQQQCKDRWKEIEGKAADGDENENKKNDNGGKKGGKGKPSDEEIKQRQMEKQQKKAEEKKKEEAKNEDKSKDEKKRQEAAPAPTPAKAADKPRGEARFTANEWKTLQEDNLFRFSELQLLIDLVLRDSGQTWIRVASRFFDKTGRRVHPLDIRDKFEQMRKMS